METHTLHGAPPATLAILLDDPDEHDFPSARRLLDGLSAAQALCRPAGLPTSIAEIVAHLIANARFNLALLDADDPASVPYSEMWPTVAEADWPALRETYFDALAELQRRAADDGDQARVIFAASESEPAWTVGYKLTASVAHHAAYHLGQIATLRRLVGVP